MARAKTKAKRPPNKPAPTKVASKKTASKEAASKKAASKKTASKEAASKKAASKQAAKPREQPAIHPEGVPSIDELLELWRRTREPRVADVLEELAKRAPLVEAPKPSSEARWRAWANARTTTDLPSLIEVFQADRLDVFDRFGPDPRIGRFLVRAIASYRPWSGTPRYQESIVAMCDRLATHADLEVVERLARVTRIHAVGTGYITSSEWFDREIAAFTERLRSDVPASTADRDLVERCDGWIEACRPKPPGPRGELFAAVYAAPDDDGPRAVLADVLQQVHSPHGELIALQLAPPTPAIEKRVNAILREHAAACCAPAVWKALWVKSARFERGFIAAGQLNPHSERDYRAAIGAREWATVHTLYPGYFAGWGSRSDERQLALELLAHPAMKWLRRVGPIGVAELALLASYGVPLPWRSIAISSRRVDEERLPKLSALPDGARVFSSLQCLLLEVSDDTFEMLSRTPWLRGVELRRVAKSIGFADLLELP